VKFPGPTGGAVVVWTLTSPTTSRGEVRAASLTEGLEFPPSELTKELYFWERLHVNTKPMVLPLDIQGKIYAL
jgi:hypothetical protein